MKEEEIDIIRKEKWRVIGFEVYNYIIILKIDVHNSIPSYVRILGKLYWVMNFGEKKTCRQCNSENHEVKERNLNISGKKKEIF